MLQLQQFFFIKESDSRLKNRTSRLGATHDGFSINPTHYIFYSPFERNLSPKWDQKMGATATVDVVNLPGWRLLIFGYQTAQIFQAMSFFTMIHRPFQNYYETNFNLNFNTIDFEYKREALF